MKKHTSINVEKISNGWLVDVNWEESEEGKKGGDLNYGCDRIFRQTKEEALQQVEKVLELLEA